MPEPPSQSYQNHKMYVPGYHFVTGALVLLTLMLSAVQLFRAPGLTSLTLVLGAAALLGTYWYARVFPLGVQDRIICLEQRLRLARLLPADLAGRTEELSRGQLVALRFASDAELPDLVRRVVAEGIRERDAIKRLVVEWRMDRMRI